LHIGWFSKKRKMRNIIIADNQDISNAGWHYLLKDQVDISEISDVSVKKDLLQLLSEYPTSIVILDYTCLTLKSVNELLILQSRFIHVDGSCFLKN